MREIISGNNFDASVKVKGRRQAMLLKSFFVDAVVVFDDASPLKST
jgi:hypothetical protein